jgi:hypothetical protein
VPTLVNCLSSHQRVGLTKEEIKEWLQDKERLELLMIAAKPYR